jgi:glycosyltransferase involved in cell wall biosynthesis
MNNNPLISIITVVYNGASTLEQTILSVINQTYKNIEYIIIDGGSTDSTVDIIKKYEKYLAYWVSEPDKGIYQAMNKGIYHSQGEYCLFLNSGDGLLHSAVLVELFGWDFDEDIVYGNVVKISESEKYVNRGIARSEFGLYNLVVGRINHQAALIKRNLFDVFGVYSEKYRIASDWKFFLDAVIMGNVSVKYIDWNISFFDVSGISSNNRKKAHDELMEILESTIPPRILSDIKELDRYKRSSVVKLYDKLINNKNLLKIYNILFHGKSK